jgi:hypothetical protein
MVSRVGHLGSHVTLLHRRENNTYDRPKSKLLALQTLLITLLPMRFVDHAYFGWVSEVGSLISRDPLAAARIRSRVTLDRVGKKIWWRSDERLDHHAQLEEFLVNSDQFNLKEEKQRSQGHWIYWTLH